MKNLFYFIISICTLYACSSDSDFNPEDESRALTSQSTCSVSAEVRPRTIFMSKVPRRSMSTTRSSMLAERRCFRYPHGQFPGVSRPGCRTAERKISEPDSRRHQPGPLQSGICPHGIPGSHRPVWLRRYPGK